MKANNLATPRWQQMIWLGAGIGLFLIIIVLLWFVYSTLSSLTSVITQQKSDSAAFIFASTGLISHVALRILAVLVGASIAFAGLAVSFFAHEKMTAISHEGNAGKFSLAAYSPGIIGIVTGAVIIISALFAKSEYEFNSTTSNNTQIQKTAPSQIVGPRPLDQLEPPCNNPGQISCSGNNQIRDGAK